MMKIRDRENRKFLTGFRDMADFFTGNRDPIPPWLSPEMLIVIDFLFTFMEYTKFGTPTHSTILNVQSYFC